MPIVRTIFRPWEQHEVSDDEAASLAAMGHIAPEPAEEVNTDGGSEEAPGLHLGRQPDRRSSGTRLVDPQGKPESGGVERGAEEGPTKEGDVRA